MESVQSGRVVHAMNEANRSQLPGGMTLRPRKHSSLGQMIEKNPNFCIVHSRVGIFWPSDKKYYRGTVQGYNENTEKYRVLYDDNQNEEIDLQKEVFRWLGPKTCAAGYSTLMREVMALLGAENVEHENSSPSMETSTEDLALLHRPKDAVGRKLFLYWEATEEKYEAEVLAYDHRKKLHYLWYRDGELEWADLKRERFAWDGNNRMVKDFPAGLEEGTTTQLDMTLLLTVGVGEGIPRGKAAVGWRIAVYWRDDVQFYDGRVSSKDSRHVSNR